MKLHIGLNHGTMVPEFVALSDANEHDLVQARRFEYPKGSIIAMDRAYLDYGWYKSLTARGIYFVTRLRMNAIYSVIERREVLKGSGVTSDQTIQLDSIQAKKQGAPRLRRVGY